MPCVLAPHQTESGQGSPDHNAVQAYYHVLVRPASSQHLFGPEWQGAHAIIHCTDDNMRLLWHALRWRHASHQDLCEKRGRFPPREAKPA